MRTWLWMVLQYWLATCYTRAVFYRHTPHPFSLSPLPSTEDILGDNFNARPPDYQFGKKHTGCVWLLHKTALNKIVLVLSAALIITALTICCLSVCSPDSKTAKMEKKVGWREIQTPFIVPYCRSLLPSLPSHLCQPRKHRMMWAQNSSCQKSSPMAPSDKLKKRSQCFECISMIV